MKNTFNISNTTKKDLLLWTFLWQVTKPFALYFIGLVGVSFGWALMINLEPLFVEAIVDKVHQYQGSQLISLLLPYVLAYCAAGIGFILLLRYSDYLVYTFFPPQRAYITLKIMEYMTAHTARFYQHQFTGNLSNKISDVVNHTSEILSIMIRRFAFCFFTLVLVLYNVGKVHPQFAWGLMLWISIFLGGSLVVLSRGTVLTREAGEERGKVFGTIVDVLTNMMSVRLFARRAYEMTVLHHVATQSVAKEQQRDKFFLTLRLFQAISFWAFEVLCFWWLLKGVSAGTITPGGFVLVFTLNLQVLQQFWDLGAEIRSFWEKVGYVQQALGILCIEPELSPTLVQPPLIVTQGEIRFENVSFGYEKIPLFKDLTLTLNAGEQVGLVGYSGSGKSTFIHLILRLYDVQQGSIKIDGQDLREVALSSLHESITLIPQDCTLFNRTLMDNIRYGRLDATEEEVYQAAGGASLHDSIQSLPLGYETLAGDKGSLLSAGQRQRVGIARAFLKKSKIIILDEATSHLDVITEEKVQQSLDTFLRGNTTIIIAHRLATLQRVDRVLVFDGGRIVQDGRHEDLLQGDGLYRELWTTQRHITKD